MNEIIRSIEAEQLKENVGNFSVGDTVRVHAKIKEGNRERIQVFEGVEVQERLLQLERIPTVSVLRRHGRYILRLSKRLR